MARLRSLKQRKEIEGGFEKPFLKKTPQVARKGLRSFLRSHRTILLSLATSILCNICIAIFTFWLSKQNFECPRWAIDCSVNPTVAWLRSRLGTVQGIVTTFYSIGLTTITYGAHALSEAAIWPLLTKQPFTLNEIDTYLAVSRGSMSSIPFVFNSTRSKHTLLVLICAISITLSHLLAAPITGYVYNRRYQWVQYHSKYQPGSGQGRQFAQTNPPTSLLSETFSDYSSWAADLSKEPMPDYRDWYVDRAALSERGNITVEAVRMKKAVSCTGTKVKQGSFSDFTFITNMASHNTATKRKNSSTEVAVRRKPQLALWADDYAFISPNRTSARLIFAALNGTIDGGIWTDLQGSEYDLGASSIGCDVDVEFVDDILNVGDGTPGQAPSTNLSSVSYIHAEHFNSTTDRFTLNEVILWFAMAPLLCGSSVDGKQPMFKNLGTGLPVPYTSTNDDKNNWTISGLEHFIHVAIGAMAQSTTPAWVIDYEPVVLESWIQQRKLDPSRPVLLLVLPLFILACTAILAAWNSWIYRRQRLPIMRLASLAEMLKSSYTAMLPAEAMLDVLEPHEPSNLGAQKLMFGVSPEGVIGLGEKMGRFR